MPEIIIKVRCSQEDAERIKILIVSDQIGKKQGLSEFLQSSGATDVRIAIVEPAELPAKIPPSDPTSPARRVDARWFQDPSLADGPEPAFLPRY